jgi:hypothetical protein
MEKKMELVRSFIRMELDTKEHILMAKSKGKVIFLAM